MERRRVLPIVVAFAGALAVLASAVPGRTASEAASPAPAVHEQQLTLAVDGPRGLQYVEITMYAAEAPPGEMEVRLAEGKAAMLARFPGAIEVQEAEVSAQFKIYGIRWMEPFAQWFYNPAGSTGAMPAQNAFDVIKSGADAWNGAGGTPWHFDYFSDTTTPVGCNGLPESIPADGLNVVGWGHIAGGYLGYACWWRSASLVPGTPYFEATEFDIVFEPGYPYSAATLRALAVHEFGHALGLDHTEPAACPGAAMCGGDGALTYISPRQDDIFGLIALYGLAPTPTATVPPTATPVPNTPAAPRQFKAFAIHVGRD